MKTLLTTIFLFVISFAVFSQDIIKESQLPTQVLANFKAKFKPAGKVVWTKVNDNFVGTYIAADQKVKTSYNVDGDWIDTKNMVNSSELPSAITNYVKANFKATRITESSVRKTVSDSNYYYILIKKENIDDIGTLYFDIKGNFILKNIPDSFNETKDKKDQSTLHVPSSVISAFKKKYARSTIKTWTLDTNYYTVTFSLDEQIGRATFSDSSVWVCTKYTVPNKELPSPISTYVKQYYPDYKIRSCELVKEPETADYYFVYAKIGGIQQPYVNIWFTLSGKFIKRFPLVQNELAPETNKKAKESDDDTYSVEKIDAKELPSPIGVFVKKEYKDYFIKEATLNTTADGTFYIVKMKQEGQKAITELKFDTKGKFLPSKDYENAKESEDIKVTPSSDDSKTTNSVEKVDIKELPSPISSYIKKEYAGYIIKEAKLSNTNEGSFYDVTVRKEGEKATTILTFDSKGKFVPSGENSSETDNSKASSNDDSKTSGTTAKVQIKELPPTITSYIKKEYKGSIIKEANTNTTDDGTFYVVKIKEQGSKEITELTFDIQGNFIDSK